MKNIVCYLVLLTIAIVGLVRCEQVESILGSYAFLMSAIAIVILIFMEIITIATGENK